MSVLKSSALAALAALVFVSALPGQEGGGLSLEGAVEMALAKNPEVLQAQARVEAARGRALQLRARPEPQILAGLEGIPLPGLNKEGDEFEIRLGIEQLIEYPGKRALRAEIGLKGQALAETDLERVRLLLAARVKRAYWRAVFAAEAASSLERSGAGLDALIEDLQDKYRTGAAAYADVLRARVEKARLRNQALDQSREKRTAELELNELLGRPSEEPIELSTALRYRPLEANPSAIWETARAASPSMRASVLRVERAGSAVKLAALGRRPDFLAGFLLPSIRPGGWGIELGLTMPFLRPGRVRGEALEAGADEEASRLASEAMARRMRTAIETAYAAARSAEAQVLVFEQSLLVEMEDEFGVQLGHFRYGKVDATSLLDLHRTFVLAQVEHLRALLLYNLALTDLEVAGEETD